MPDATSTYQRLYHSMFNAHVLDRAMIGDIPRSAWKDCRYHIAEKSPAVHPTRHRRVLTPARFQTGVELQNCVEDNDDAAAALLAHSVLALLLLHASLRCTVESPGRVHCNGLHAKTLRRCIVTIVWRAEKNVRLIFFRD